MTDKWSVTAGLIAGGLHYLFRCLSRVTKTKKAMADKTKANKKVAKRLLEVLSG